jgi:hypothetical protein
VHPGKARIQPHQADQQQHAHGHQQCRVLHRPAGGDKNVPQARASARATVGLPAGLPATANRHPHAEREPAVQGMAVDHAHGRPRHPVDTGRVGEQPHLQLVSPPSAALELLAVRVGHHRPG